MKTRRDPFVPRWRRCLIPVSTRRQYFEVDNAPLLPGGKQTAIYLSVFVFGLEVGRFAL